MELRRWFYVAATAVVGVVTWVPIPAHAGPGRQPNPPGVDPTVLKAMERDLHLDEATARRRVADEAAAAAAEAMLVPALGAAYAGSWFDATSGKLVVGITDATRAEQVHRGGATPKVAPYSSAELDAIKSRLDAVANATPSAASGVAAWHVDPVGNRVVVTTLAGRPQGALARTAAAHGAAVRFETTTDPAVATSDFLDGGEGILSAGGRCSVGFNARLTYSDLPGVSDPVMISAGHCVTSAPDVWGMGNSKIAASPLGRWWMRDHARDWAIAGSLDTSYWVQGPWISLHTPNDDWTTVHGTQQRPVGSSVCKSGLTTDVTCGVIRARNETVYQSDTGRTVFGLTRDTTCQEPGDSGGPRYTADIQAQGISSSAVTHNDASGRPRCLATINQENRSWYVEITYIQAYAGARVLTG